VSATIEIGTTKSFSENPGNSGSALTESAPLVSAGSDPRPTLVIGDIHGHYDRLEALLKQEGIVGKCPLCGGFGDRPSPGRDDPISMCRRCEGDGICRINFDVEVVLLGDLGHFGAKGSPNGDVLTWRAGLRWADVILWGNHDRAMVENQHAFTDFHRHPHEAFHLFELARLEGKLKLAHTSHGYLFTHAGLHVAFKNQQNVAPEVKTDPQVFCDWINTVEDPDAQGTAEMIAVRDAIGRKRGGRSSAGGILWRDISEKLYDKWPQVFGHSADRQHMVAMCWRNGSTRQAGAPPPGGRPSYCVDVGGKGDKPGDACLAGIWLPQERIVRVDL
jgi:hypothetical protein